MVLLSPILHHKEVYVKDFTSLYGNNSYMEVAKMVGANLKQARKDMGLTQKEVAAKMLMTQQQYSRFENGVFQLNYEQILALCKLYGVTPNTLFGIDP